MGQLPWIANQSTRIDLGNNITFRRSLPDSFSFGLNGGDHKTDWDIGLPWNFLVLLHQGNIDFSILVNLDPILRVIEPAIIRFRLEKLLHLFELFGLHHRPLLSHHIGGASPSVSLPRPISFNWVHFPWLWENLTNGYFFKLLKEISETHPPRPINFLCFWHIFQLFFYGFVLFPVIGFLAESPCPDSFVSPRVSEPDELQVVFGEVSHVDYGVVMVLQNSLLPLFCIPQIFPLDCVDAAQQEFLLEEIDQSTPNILRLKGFFIFLSVKRHWLRNSACQVNQSFKNWAPAYIFVVFMKFHICFFNELNPEFLGVGARTVEADSSVVLLFVWQESVNYNLCPWSILKELEGHKSSIEVFLLNDEFLDDLRLRSCDSQAANEPTGPKNPMFGIDIHSSPLLVLFDNHELGVFDNFFRPFPFQIF